MFLMMDWVKFCLKGLKSFWFLVSGFWVSEFQEDQRLSVVSALSAFLYLVTGFQRYRVSEFQEDQRLSVLSALSAFLYLVTGFQSYRVTALQGYRVTEFQGYRVSGRSAFICSFRVISVPLFSYRVSRSRFHFAF